MNKNSLLAITTATLVLLFVIFYTPAEHKQAPTPVISRPVVPTQPTTPPSVVPLDIDLSPEAVALWENYSNTEIGISFKYPKTWRITDAVKVRVDSYSYDFSLFNTTEDPYAYGGRPLKEGVMKAQANFNIDKSIHNKGEYLDTLLKVNDQTEMGSLIDPMILSSLTLLSNEHGLEIFKFKSKAFGNTLYIIPKKPDFSEVISLIVWGPENTLDKVLSTFKFLN